MGLYFSDKFTAQRMYFVTNASDAHSWLPLNQTFPVTAHKTQIVSSYWAENQFMGML